MNEWSELLRQCELAVPGRNAIRLANLAIATAAGGQRNLIRLNHDDKNGFAESLVQLAVEPVPWDPAEVQCHRLVTLAENAASRLCHLKDMNDWVQAFQSSDPARKSRGAYATPPVLARPMARELLKAGTPTRIVDPSSGPGGLLIAVLTELKLRAHTAAETKAHVARLHGVELDPVARELSCLVIWLHASVPDLPPQLIAERIITGNAITRDWWSDESFDALIMNPPWDSLRHRRDASTREDLEREETLTRLLIQCRGANSLPPLYSAQGRGDRNLYKAFVELAPHLLCEGGRLVALVPGAWSSDLGTAALRRMYLEQMGVEQWTSFENQRGYFPIDGRYKFGILIGTRSSAGTVEFKTRGFAADAADLRSSHVAVKAHDLVTLGGPAVILPDLVSVKERNLLLRYLSNGHSLFSANAAFGHVRYERELDMTEDRKSGAFIRLEDAAATPRGDGTWLDQRGNSLVPLVEGRMVSAYDFHAKSWQSGSGRTAVWTWSNGTRLIECRPQFLAPPRPFHSARIAICDVTSATNTRTVLASWVPPTWPCGNTAPVLVFESQRLALAGLAVLNSMVFDWLARRLVAGLHLNRFYLEALKWPALDEAQLETLAAAAADLTSLSPRYSALVDGLATPGASLEYVEALAHVEHVVANGYGLSRADLEAIYNPDASDRRGFWRHFVSDPHSLAVVKTVFDAPAARSSGTQPAAELAAGKRGAEIADHGIHYQVDPSGQYSFGV
jgi:hypothetical protein